MTTGTQNLGNGATISAAEYRARAQKKSKYRNKSVVIDGRHFASIKEGKRYQQLCLLLQYQKISQLELQPKYPLIVAGVKVCTYIADFRYVDEHGRQVIEDVKGFKTPTYLIKRRLMKAIHNIDVVEV